MATKQAGEVRAVHIALNVLANCQSSACVEIGRTRVICVVRPPQQLVHEYRGTRGRVTCVVHRSPTGGAEATVGGSGVGVGELDMALALEGVAEQVVALHTVPQLLVETVIEVARDDGALWDAASTALTAALAVGGLDLYDVATACTAGLLPDGSVAADLTAEQERRATALLTVCAGLQNRSIYYTCHRGLCEPGTLQRLSEEAMLGIDARREHILAQIRNDNSNTV